MKAFNHLFARDLATRGRRELPLSERTVLFVAGDDEDARRVVFGLIADIGFAAVDTGSLREGGRLMQPGSPIYTRPLRASEVPAVLGLDNGGEANATPRTESANPDDP